MQHLLTSLVRPTGPLTAAVIVLALAVSLAAGGAPVAAGEEPSPTRDATVIAHRGASAYAPENTIPAVELGVEMGAPLVEIDIQLSADRQIVLLHDTTLGRTTDVHARMSPVDPRQQHAHVAFFTAGELAELDAGCWGRFAGSEYCGTPVPTFAQVLDAVADTPDVGILIEVKSPQHHPGIEALLVAELAARADAGQDNPHVVQSFDWQSMRLFDELQHVAGLDLPVGLLGKVAEADFATYAWAEQINPSHGSIDRPYVAAAQEAGFSVNPYTVNEPCRMAELVDHLGVDGIITDRPDVMHRVLTPDAEMAAELAGC